MKKLLLATAASILMISGANATALVLGPGTFSDASCSVVCDGSFTNGPEIGAISDTYSFTISGGSVLMHTASATNSTTLPGEIINNFMIELFSGTPTGTNMFLESGTGATNTPTEQFTGGLPDIALSAGNYFLELTGQNQGTQTTYAGSYSFSPAAVPLPGTLPLLAGGLGAMWMLRRRREAA